jgi:hypothetical protein
MLITDTTGDGVDDVVIGRDDGYIYFLASSHPIPEL